MKAKLFPWFWGLTVAVNWLSLQSLTASVDVYGEATSSGPIITVKLYADIKDSPLLSFGVRLFYDANTLRVLDAAKNSAEWYFFDETAEVSYLDPDVSMLGEVLMIGGKMDAHDPLQGIAGNHVLLGTARFGRLLRSTPKFEVAIGRLTPYANFVTTEGKVLETQTQGVTFGAVSPDPSDVNLDGLKDDWQLRYFGSLDKYSYDDDPDRDGFDNQIEQALGSDPTDPNSNLRVTVAQDSTGVLIEWPSALDRVYTIESAGNLPDFRPLKTGIPATPPSNRFLIDLSELKGASFYRVLLQDTSGLR